MALAELRNNAIERRNFLAPSMKLDDQKFEFIFVLDRSGSMQGEKIQLAQNALTLFLRSLPVTCKFNVIGFGDRFDKLFASSVNYSEANLNTAVQKIPGMGANLGGTSMYATLMDVYNTAQTPGYLTQIFVLTDGQPTDAQPPQVIQLVQNNKTFARVFSLGIGTDVDRTLITGVATTGGGVCEFVASGYEKIQTKIQEQLQIALKPSLLKAVPVAC